MVDVLERQGTRGNGSDADGEKVFVTVIVAGQLCGLPVHAVRDILDKQTITPIPLARPRSRGASICAGES